MSSDPERRVVGTQAARPSDRATALGMSSTVPGTQVGGARHGGWHA